MADVSISQLTTSERTTASDLFEVAIPAGDGSYLSRKTSLNEVANATVDAFEYSSLNSTNKKIIGAINEALDAISELELFKFPNVTIIGSPTINHGQISDFSSSDYLKFPFLVDFHSKPFEINMAFTTGSNVVSQENIFDSDYGLAFAIRNRHFVIAVSTNGTTWDLGEGVGSYTVIANTTYYVRLSWNGSSYKLAYSLDGSTYTDDITKAGTSQPYPRQIYIGVGENFASVVNHFAGTINLNKADLRIDGEVVWVGMDDAGLSTRADVSLSNIDADGEGKIKEVMSEDINQLKAFDEFIDQDIYDNSSISPYQSISGWKLRLDNTGFSVADNGYKLVKFQITQGETYMVKGAEIYQFQQNASVPASPPSQKVGDQSTEPIFTAPNVRYLIVSAPVDTTVTLTKVNNKIKTDLSQLEALVNDMFIKSGETLTFTACAIYGYISGGQKRAFFSLPVGKSLVNVSAITTSTFKANLRTVNGQYLDNSSSTDGLEWYDSSKYAITLSVNKQTNTIEGDIRTLTDFANVPANNSPIVGLIRSATFTFT